MNRVISPISNFSVWISAGLVLLMALLTVVDVIARSLFNSPIGGVIEIEQFMLAVVVFLAIAHTETKNGHVSVDILSRKYPRKISLFVSSVSNIIFMFCAILYCWYQVEKSIESFRMNEAGLITGIPHYPILLLTAFGCALLFLVLLVKFLKHQSEVFRVFSRPWLWIFLMLLTGAGIIFTPEILKALTIEMAPFTVGLVGTALLMVFLFAGIPIAVAIGFSGMIGIWYLQDWESVGAILQMTVYSSVSEYLFTVLPLFVGMGLLSFASGLSENLYGCFHRVFGGFRGSLAMATVAGSAGFASICGDSMATAATMGSVALPEMRKHKYGTSLATGCVAAGGTLGILIPPSIGFIIYAMITEQSVGKLFLAGILPGILLAAVFCAMIYIQCRINPAAGPPGPKTPVIEKMVALREIWPILLMFLVVMGGLYSGIFTATEAGAVGLFSAVIIGLLLRRFTRQSFIKALISTSEVTAMVFTVLIGVNVLNYFIGLSELSQRMAEFVVALPLSSYWILTVILVMYVILGCLMAIIPMMMLTLPMIFPIVTDLGFNPIWFGVIIVIVMEMGMITPPIGINVFVIAGVAKDIPMGTIFKGVTVFLVAMILVIVILTIFPDIAL
ncbi:MAG: TRAP transporter large permease subunit, partial [Deltaproteobacteria bacterium]|nr:TRAP transporter large permease subunit [Deltaproteobacteria bacterium]